MVVIVKLLGSLRASSRRTKFGLEVKDATPLREVIMKIVEDRPALKEALVDPEHGGLRTNTLILINGKEISVLQGTETMLNDDDEVVLVPVIHGG
jgi:molybdopterin converting factor small subunit